MRAQLNQIAQDELKLRRVIPWLFHHDGKPIVYETLRNNWRRAAAAAGYPGKLRCITFGAPPRRASTPGISLSVAMTLLGHKTDMMFRRYIQRHDERLIEAATTLADQGQIECREEES